MSITSAAKKDIAPEMSRTTNAEMKAFSYPSSQFELVNKVRAILHEHGYTEPCYPLEDLAETIDKTQSDIMKKVYMYKWPGWALLLLIPLLATFVSVFVQGHPVVAKYLSYALTALALCNAIFKPRERFQKACDLGIKAAQFKDDFLAKLEIHLSAEDEDDIGDRAKLLTFIEKTMHHFAPIQRSLIDLFLPDTPAGSDRRGGRRSTDEGASVWRRSASHSSPKP